METLSYKIESFEGPMDLLLHLISKHKVRIEDVPIMDLINQYLDYMKKLKEENLEVTSEFLEMAARLVYIKTVSLLPVHEEADRLAEELRGELTEYRDCQLMAGKLAEQANGFNFFSREPQEIDVDMTYTRLHEGNELLRAYLNAAGRKLRNLPPPVEVFREIVAKKIVSVGSKIRSIFTKLSKAGKKEKMTELFNGAESRSDLVATFLAILELAKSKKINVIGDGADVDIELLATDIEEMNSEEWE